MEVLKSFFIIIVVVLSFGVAVIAGRNGLLSARCAARCLTEHKDSLRGGTDRNNHRKYKMLDRCRRHSRCFECMKPCAASVEDLDQRKCEVYCEENESMCKKSCQFLYYTSTYKSGDCPRPESAMGFEAVCLASCMTDSDCVVNKKCCPNMCGRACRTPDYTNFNLPLQPLNISFEERRHGRALQLSWILPNGTRTVPGVVVYVLEHRNSTSQKPSWNDNTPWDTVVVSQSRSVLIRQIHAGHWYQFRVAAVSDKGTQGFSSLSEPYKSSRRVQNPLPPQNITKGVTTLRKGQVDITIHWQPPKYSDMPIWKYVITYSERLSSISPVLVRIPVLEKNIPGHVHEFKLKKLKPGTTYHIQIKAIIQHGNRQLQSNKVSKYITTYAPPGHQDTNDIEGLFATLVDDRAMEDNQESVISVYAEIIQVEKLEVVDNLPYFNKGSLKALLTWKVGKDFLEIVKSFMIYWSPHSCDQDYAEKISNSATSDVTRFEVYDLQYECQYTIRVSAVTKWGVQGKPSTVKLRTPICQKILVKSNSLPPECPARVPQVPKSPRNVDPQFIPNNCSINLHISWKHPKSDQPIVAYRIKYDVTEDFKEEEEEGSTDGTVHKQTPIEISLEKVTTYTIYSLRHSEVYIIRIYAISNAGLGEPAYIEILTPHILPCGSDKDPEPPDSVEDSLSSSTVFLPPEVSTVEGNNMVPVSIATVFKNKSSTNLQTPSTPKLNIYQTVYYLFLFLYKLITGS